MLLAIVAGFDLVSSTVRAETPWTVATNHLTSNPSQQPPKDVDFDIAAMQAELARLATVCDRLGLNAEAELCREWLPDETRSDRQLLFLPTPFPTELPGTDQAKWCQHFIAARRNHARWLFTEAQRLASADDEATAYRLLWRVVREDPEHVEAKRALGPMLTSVQVRPRLRPSARQHEKFAWEANSYSTIQSPHFMLTTRAETRESVAIAQQLEEAHALWTQVFFEQWSAPGVASRRIENRGGAWPETRKMEVVLLKDRADYLQTLGVREQNIDVSVGYYNPRGKLSFFYPSDDLTETFHHELTHQLFSEASRLNVQLDAGEAGGVWQLEGIALYMESLRDHGQGCWTVGGIDAPRMQSARYRAVRDGYWPAWQTFAAATVDQWKNDPNVALLYSHAAGLTHTMLDLSDANTRAAYLKALEDIYIGEPRNSLKLLDGLGIDEEAAKLAYQEQMTVSESQLQALLKTPSAVAELVLAGSELSHELWLQLGQFKELEWLDLSFANCNSGDLGSIADLKKLRRLSIEGTVADGQLLATVANLPMLHELDLSGCNITDDDLRALQGSRLEILWLTKTQVSDQCLDVLASMKQLKSCDISGTRISAERWQQFSKEHGLE